MTIMTTSQNRLRGVVVVPGPPDLSDEVYYSERDGLLIARLPQTGAPSRAVRMHVLNPNAVVEVRNDGAPILFEITDRREAWARRRRVKPETPVTPGRIAFQGPGDYRAWAKEPAVVVGADEWGSVLVELSNVRPDRGIQLSPRIVLYLGEEARLSSLLLTEVSRR